MIRGGHFGEEFSIKLFMALAALAICLYDWKVNDRLDYFWIFLIGSIIWTCVEISLQLRGARVMQEKYFFGINITNELWLTLPLQGMSEAAAIAIMGIFFGDRIMKRETRKTWLIIFGMFLSLFLLYLINGIHFNDVNVGGKVPSRREMFTLVAIIVIVILIAPAILLFVKSSSGRRRRGIYMFLVMTTFATFWTFMEWLVGQRWIEIGTVNPDGSYSNLRMAPPLIAIGALAFDIFIEIALLYVSFLAIAYFLRLIDEE